MPGAELWLMSVAEAMQKWEAAEAARRVAEEVEAIAAQEAAGGPIVRRLDGRPVDWEYLAVVDNNPKVAKALSVTLLSKIGVDTS